MPRERIDFWYHRLLDIKHMVIVAYFVRGNPLMPHRLLLPISNMFFSMYFPTDRTAHTRVFGGLVVDHWLEQKVAQTANDSAMQDRTAMQEDQNLYSWMLYHLSYVPPPKFLSDQFDQVLNLWDRIPPIYQNAETQINWLNRWLSVIWWSVKFKFVYFYSANSTMLSWHYRNIKVALHTAIGIDKWNYTVCTYIRSWCAASISTIT